MRCWFLCKLLDTLYSTAKQSDVSLPIGSSSSLLNINGAPRVISDIVGAVDRGRVTHLGLLEVGSKGCLRHGGSYYYPSGSAADKILVSAVLCLYGLRRSFWAAPSRCGIWVRYHPSVDWISAFRRIRISALYFPAVHCRAVQNHSQKGAGSTLMYADDTLLQQVHLSVPASESSVAARQFSECIEEIDGRMQTNRLKMNTNKTQLVWIETRQQLSRSASIRSNSNWTRYRPPRLCRTWA